MIKQSLLTIAIGATLASMPAQAATEIEELRAQLDAVSQCLEELDSSHTPNRTDRVQIKGDVRFRYEYQSMDDETQISRYRMRGRVGAFAQVNDNLEAAVTLATGQVFGNTGRNATKDDKPFATMQDVDENANQKVIWLDLAYFTYTSPELGGLSTTFGKMRQPWIQVSDLMIDADVNPEGMAAAYDLDLNGIKLMTRAGYHVMDERSSLTNGIDDDIALASGQLAAQLNLAEGVVLTCGAGAFFFNNTEDALGTGYDLIDGLVKLELKNTPLKFYGEYIKNVAADAEDECAWLVGAGTKYKKLGLDYSFRDLSGNGINPDFADGDFGGTDYRGHRVKLGYDLMKNWNLCLNVFSSERADGKTKNRFQLDTNVKF